MDLPLNLIPYSDESFKLMHGAGSGMISASNIAALFGRSRWTSRFAYMAHVMGRVPMPEVAGAHIERGKRLERVVAEMVAEDKGWTVSNIRAWAGHPAITGLYSSPDGVAWRPDREDPGVLELKTVDSLIFEREWLGGVPLDIELQHQTQLACTGARWGAIAILVLGIGRFDLIVYETEPHAGTIRAIEREAAKALQMIKAGELPAIDDDSAHTVEALRALYPVEEGKEASIPDEERAEGARRWEAWAQARLDRLAAEKIEEAQKRWFSVRGPGAALIRVDNARTIEVKQSPVKAKTIPATTMTRFTLRDGSQEAA